MKKNILLTILFILTGIRCTYAIEYTYTYHYDFVSNGNYYAITSEEEPLTVKMVSGDYIWRYWISGEAYRGEVHPYENVQSLVIPSYVDYQGKRYTVTSIEGFRDCKQLSSITISNSITRIEAFTFNNCPELTSVTIPNSVTHIERYAFSNCPKLTSITIPSSVVYLCGFEGCNITDVIIPESVKHLDAFSGNPLSSVTIPESVTYLDGFRYCNLTAITIPHNVDTLYAFEGCSGITSIVWNARKCSKISISSMSGSTTLSGSVSKDIVSFTFGDEVESIPSSLCSDLSKLTSIAIPNSVTSIGESAFRWCEGLTSITIPNSVTSIGDLAFEDCTGLTSVTIGNSVASIGGGAFEGCTGLTSITIPNSVTSIRGGAFRGCTGLTSVTIPSSVTSIEGYTFEGCTGLTSITIPNSVTSIKFYAFEGCTNITSVIWNAKTCRYQCDNARDCIYGDGRYESPFEDAKKNITSFIFGTEVDTIPANLCRGMEKLTSIIIPENVTSIGSSVFRDCTNLSSVNWNAKVCQDFSTEETPFYRNSATTNYRYSITEQITSFTFGDKVKHIPACLCRGMEKLSSVTIPNSVTSIGYDAFDDCNNLTKTNYTGDIAGWCAISFGGYGSGANPIDYSHNLYINGTEIRNLVIPNSVMSIGDKAFCSCYSLTSVTIGNSVTSIGESAFNCCTGLTSVTIGNSVTSIGERAFNGCTGLTSVTIGNSVTSIGERAFNGCTSLTSITIPNSVTSIGGGAFKECTRLTSAMIDATTIDYQVFDGCTGLKYLALGNKVDSIGTNAFRDCTNLDSIRISAVLPPKVDTTYSWREVFDYDVMKKAILSVPCGSKKAYQNAPCWRRFTNILEPASIYSMKVLSSNTRYGTAAITQSISACNDEAIITANPYNSYYHFVQWNDGNTDNPRTVIVTQDTTFTAEFAPNQYTITASGEHGTVEGTGTYDYNTKVYLTAVPDKGYHFVKWNNGKTYNPYYIYVRSDTTLTATFALNQYTITTYAQNGNVSGGGTYDYGTTATLTATADAHYHFTQWSDGNTDNPRTVSVVGDATYTAEFKPDSYTIIVSAGEHGSVNGGGTYDYGTTATLTATADEHYHFTQWSDGNTDNPRTVSVVGDATYTAEFAIDQHTITTNAHNGTITGGGTYDYGTTITLTATADEHYHFTQWNDGNTDNPRTVSVEDDATYTTEFRPDQFTISATCDPQHGMVMITGAGTYDYGTQVTLTAVANKGYEFAQWSNGVTDNPYLLTATADLTLEAQFIPATAVDNVSADGTTPQKIIRDGQVYILRNGKTYTTTGVEVK